MKIRQRFKAQLITHLIVTVLSPPVFPDLESRSMLAPEYSLIALILHPPLPISLLTTCAGTLIFFDFLVTSFHSSSFRFDPTLTPPPFFAPGEYCGLALEGG